MSCCCNDLFLEALRRVADDVAASLVDRKLVESQLPRLVELSCGDMTAVQPDVHIAASLIQLLLSFGTAHTSTFIAENLTLPSRCKM